MPAHALIRRFVNTPDRFTATAELDALAPRIPQFYFEFVGSVWSGMKITPVLQSGMETEAAWWAAVREVRHIWNSDLFADFGTSGQPAWMSPEFIEKFRLVLLDWYHSTLREQVDPKLVTFNWDHEGGNETGRDGFHSAMLRRVVETVTKRWSNYHWVNKDSVSPRIAYEHAVPISGVNGYLIFQEGSGFEASRIVQCIQDNAAYGGSVVFLGDPWIYGDDAGATWGAVIDAVLAAEAATPLSVLQVIQFPSTGIDGVTLPEGETRATQDVIIQAKIEDLMGVGE